MSGPARVIITGATAGLGRATADVLARSEEHQIVIAARDLDRGRAVAAAMGRIARHPVLVVSLDLASLASVRAAPDALDRLGVGTIAALVCNAGVQEVSGMQRTVDGFERTFAVNHLAHMGLACALLPRMETGGRLVFVASNTHDPAARTGMPAPVWLEPAELARGVDNGGDPVAAGRVRYTTSKLCNVLCARRFARDTARSLDARLRSVRIAAFDPGMMPGTSLARDYGPLIRFAWTYLLPALTLVQPNVNTVRTSARRLAGLVTDGVPAWPSGSYISRGIETRPSDWALDDLRADELWDGSATLLRAAGFDVSPSTVRREPRETL